MSAERYWCSCGRPVLVHVEACGQSYAAIFTDPHTAQEVSHCPGCSVILYHAMRAGDLSPTAPLAQACS